MPFLYLLGRHPEEVEADLASEYNGLDLVDLWRGGLSLRKAAALVAQLPPGSRVWQATGGPRAWSDTVHTLMVLELRLRYLLWAQTDDGEKGKNPPKMQPYPELESDEEAKAAKADSKAEIFLRRQREREQRLRGDK